MSSRRAASSSSATTGRATGRWSLGPLLYDLILERPLMGIRRQVAKLAAKEGLFPLLDICCGPGTQLRRIAPEGPAMARSGQGAGAGIVETRNGVNGPDALVVGLDLNLKSVKYAAARGPGTPFICGDASALPFRPGAFRGALLSFALHEQEPAVRRRFLAAAREALAAGGRLIIVDFEKPWNSVSRLARGYTTVIELFGGRDHLRLNRDFFRRGGLRALLAENGFTEVMRHDIAAGTCAIVLAAPLSNFLLH